MLDLIVHGATSPEIALQLKLSVHTVDTYRSRLMQKLAIEDLPQLVLFALRHGLIVAK